MSGSTQPQLPCVTGVETIKRLKTVLCSAWDLNPPNLKMVIFEKKGCPE